jgi:glycosyltransferase involved in cell wall biosynthesis
MPIEIIVVADGCTDDTEAVARGLGAHVIRRELRRGQGAAIRLGYLAALRGQARVIASLDADGQHDPKELERVVAPLIASEADMVQGSRVLGTFEKESRVRATGVHVYAKIMSTLGRTKITDPANGYRAVTPEALQRLDLRQDQFVASELIMDAMHKGLRVVEVPITVRKRAVGETKKGTTFRYAWGFSKTMLGTWLRQPSRKQEAPPPRWLANAGIENGDPKKAEEVEARSYAGAMSGEEPPRV